MLVTEFVDLLDADFYTGVPDSLLQPLCNYLMTKYGVSAEHHIIGANEGNCVGLAAGYYLATGKPAVVYLQNSGIGNAINPIASLLNDRVYGIPCIFVIGWRGEPGIHDEPQHAYQGLVTVKLMEDMDIETCIVSEDMSAGELSEKMTNFKKLLDAGKQVAFIIRKNALKAENKIVYSNNNSLIREDVIGEILRAADNDLIVSTTGKISRELFEERERKRQSHERDFLTVGSMGHSSSIALSLALQRKERRIWCIDGDGSLLMHMGAMTTIGNLAPQNFVHIVLNNGAHESVGGLPTVAGTLELAEIAQKCGYQFAKTVSSYQEMVDVLRFISRNSCCTFLEIKVALSSRSNLGRPTLSAAQSCKNFRNAISAASKISE